MSKQNLPFLPQRYFDFGGLPDAGGWVWIYLKGTNTPATSAIWYDADGITPGANPIPLNSAGQPEDTGVFYLNAGSYTLKLFGADGTQIGPPVDAIVFGSAFGGGSETISQGSGIICKTYADVRGLIEAWDAIYVCGRSGDGDGGEGWFQRVPTSTETDDDGICLVAGTKRFQRVFDGPINPAWYGLVYGGTTDQWTKFAIVGAASLHWTRSALFTGDVYLAQNGSILSGWSIKCDGLGRFISATGSPVALTFRDGSEFDGIGECFGPEVDPIFERNVVPSALLSWMGGVSGDQRLEKWASSSSAPQVICLDDVVTTSTLPTFPSGVRLDNAQGKITLTAPANLSVDVVYQGVDQWLDWEFPSNVGTVNIGYRPCHVGWFGAVGDGATEDNVALLAAFKSGWAKLGFGKYLLGGDINLTALRLDGMLSNACGDGVFSGLSTMPASSLIMASDKTITTSIGIDLDSVGVYCSGGNITVGMAYNFSAKNCVLGCFDGATITAGKIDTQDCYANSSLIFQTSTGKEIFHSNLMTNGLPGKRIYSHGVAVGDIYHLDEIGKSSQYDIVITANNDDGLAEGKTSIALDKISSRYLVESGIEVTNIRFHWYDQMGTPSCDVYRSEVLVGTFANVPAYYTIRETDSQTIIVRIEGWVYGWPDTSILPSSSKPSNSVRNTIINTTPSISSCFVGETTPLHMHNVVRLSLPNLVGNIIAQGIWTGTSWAFSA